jgi:hypothetical protein
MPELITEVRDRCAAALRVTPADVDDFDRFTRRWWLNLGLPLPDAASGARGWFTRRPDHPGP